MSSIIRTLILERGMPRPSYSPNHSPTSKLGLVGGLNTFQPVRANLVIVLLALACFNTIPAQTYEVWATTFGPPGDGRNLRMANRQMMRRNTIAAALPHKSALNKIIWVKRSSAHKWVRVKVQDVGPWNTNDSYWKQAERPRAEVQHREKSRQLSRGGRLVENPAGIDLTWTVWQLLGIPKSKAGNHSEKVQFRFEAPDTSITSDLLANTGNISSGAIKVGGSVLGTAAGLIGGTPAEQTVRIGANMTASAVKRGFRALSTAARFIKRKTRRR
jgi:hypothetical protein